MTLDALVGVFLDYNSTDGYLVVWVPAIWIPNWIPGNDASGIVTWG